MKPSVQQVDILNAQIEWFGDPEAASVEQMNDQPGGVAVHVGYRCEQVSHFPRRGTRTQEARTFGSKRVDITELLFEGFAIKKEQGIESLVLGRSGNASFGEHGQECFDLLFSGLVANRLTLEKLTVALEPVTVGFLSADGEVFSSASVSD